MRTMLDMTEEKYGAFDERWTKNTHKVDPNGSGFFAQRKAKLTARSARSITVDSFTADLLTKAIATNKTPADIIGEMVQKEIGAVQ